jgi:hypothetical protein
MKFGVRLHKNIARHSLTVCQSDVRLSSKQRAIKLRFNDFMFLVHCSVQFECDASTVGQQRFENPMEKKLPIKNGIYDDIFSTYDANFSIYGVET